MTYHKRPKDSNTLGGRIRNARIGNMMSQQELADALPVERPKKRAAVAQYEQDGNLPPLDTLVDIAAILGADPAYLAFGASEKRTQIPAFSAVVDIIVANQWTKQEAAAIKALLDSRTHH